MRGEMDLSVPVYINWGRFVVDCPCGDAREVQPGQSSVTCVNGHTVELAWPDNAGQIMAALNERTAERRRNWFPRKHPLAVALGEPHGQSVDELRREAEDGEARDAQHLADRRAALFAQAAELGITAEDMANALKGS